MFKRRSVLFKLKMGGLFLATMLASLGQAAEGVGINDGVPLSAKTGKVLKCRDEDVLKKDYLNQLQRHEVYGNPELLSTPKITGAAKYYQNKLADLSKKKAGPNLTPNLFSGLKANQLFDGAKVLQAGDDTQIPQPGDVLLNMTFLNPYNAGSFYSKRGMIHARVIVNAQSSRRGVILKILDGGWQQFSQLSQIHAQTIWLRPKVQYFQANDRQNLQKWAQLFEPVPYDNRLIDNLSEYRALQNSLLEKLSQLDADNDGAPDLTPREVQEQARQNAMDESSDEGFYPYGRADTETPKSGFYCSEAGSDIYSYLGFRLYGEVPFEVATAFSSDGKLPQWKVYEEALSGFGANHGPVYMMHKQFFAYFTLLDAAWRKEIIPLPAGYTGSRENFTAIAWKNRENALKQAASDGSDPMLEQLDDLIAKSANNAELNAQAVASKAELTGLVQQMAAVDNIPNLNLTAAVDMMFFKTKAYGPNHFLENGDYFELKGAFYNTDLQSGYQAKWVADAGTANASTTLYQIDPSADVAADGGCITSTEALPALPTHK